jgi:hypothetical protein
MENIKLNLDCDELLDGSFFADVLETLNIYSENLVELNQESILSLSEGENNEQSTNSTRERMEQLEKDEEETIEISQETTIFISDDDESIQNSVETTILITDDEETEENSVETTIQISDDEMNQKSLETTIIISDDEEEDSIQTIVIIDYNNINLKFEESFKGEYFLNHLEKLFSIKYTNTYFLKEIKEEVEYFYDQYEDAGVSAVSIKCKNKVILADFNLHGIIRIKLPEGSFDKISNDLNGDLIIHIVNDHKNIEIISCMERDGHKVTRLEVNTTTYEVDVITYINLRVKFMMLHEDYTNGDFSVNFHINTTFIPEEI